MQLIFQVANLSNSFKKILGNMFTFHTEFLKLIARIIFKSAF